MGGDGEDEVGDHSDRRGDADRRPEDASDQAGRAGEEDEREIVELVRRDADPGVGLDDLGPMGELADGGVGERRGE